VVEAVGVVLLSRGLKQIGEVQTMSAREIGRIIAKGATIRASCWVSPSRRRSFGALLYLLSQPT